MNGNASYSYRAARRDGALERGSVDASSRDAAAAILAARGLFALEIRLGPAREPSRSRIPAADLALGLRSLATLLESGLTLSRALPVLGELVPKSWASSLPVIHDAVREGSGLGAALAAAPLGMPRVALGIIEAGEAGSGLAAAVARAADELETYAAWRAAVLGALAYPAVVAVTGAASVALLVGLVLPRFARILEELGQDLPFVTRLLLDTVEALTTIVPLALVLAPALLVMWHAWTRDAAGLRRWHELLARLPWLGGLRRSAATARACSALGRLLESGVPVAAALVPAAAATGDAAMEARLLSAREGILRGQGIAAALDDAGALTPTVVRLARAGEESGRLAALLARGARLEADQVERRVRFAVRLAEPVLILGLAGMVAWVAAALLQAVYSVSPGP